MQVSLKQLYLPNWGRGVGNWEGDILGSSALDGGYFGEKSADISVSVQNGLEAETKFLMRRPGIFHRG